MPSLRLPVVPRFAVLVLAAALAGCGAEPDRAEAPPPTGTEAPVPPGAAPADTLGEADPARLRALNTALDSLETLVITLERIEGPIAAWNRASEAARLLRYLERNRSAFALDMSEEEAARRYPTQISRLNALEARRAAELERIGEDPVAMQVLLEEIAKADAEADTTAP